MNATYRPSSRRAAPGPGGPGAAPYMGSSYVPAGGAPGYGNPYMPGPAAPPAASPQLQTQQIYIPNDLVGCIIGKGGSHVNEIREKSGARVMVSESIPGNPERILNVSGPLDAVSKVCHERFVRVP